MTLEIDAPDRGEYEGFDRYVTINDNNKYIEFTANNVKKQGSRFNFYSDDWFRCDLRKMEDGYYITNGNHEEEADIMVKISEEHKRKLLQEFNSEMK